MKCGTVEDLHRCWYSCKDGGRLNKWVSVAQNGGSEKMVAKGLHLTIDKTIVDE